MGKSQMKRLGGWTRLGIVVTSLWAAAILLLLGLELVQTPHPLSGDLLTDTVVTATGEPASTLRDNLFRDLVPVHRTLNIQNLLVALLVPISIMWLLGFAWAWVRAGFQSATAVKREGR
jgi:hypothetical protein